MPGYVDDPVLPVEFLPQSYIRDVLLGDDRMEPGRSSCTADPSVNNMSKPQNPTGSRTRG